VALELEGKSYREPVIQIARDRLRYAGSQSAFFLPHPEFLQPFGHTSHPEIRCLSVECGEGAGPELLTTVVNRFAFNCLWVGTGYILHKVKMKM
jgi:hypothetical protein